MKRLRLAFSIGLMLIVLALLLRQDARQQFVHSLISLSLLHFLAIAVLFAFMRLAQAISLQRALLLHRQRVGLDTSLNLMGLKGVFNLGFTGLGIAAQSMQGKTQLSVPVRVMIFANVIQVFALSAALGAGLILCMVSLTVEAGAPIPSALIFVGLVGLAAILAGFTGIVACLSPKVSTFIPSRLRLEDQLHVPRPRPSEKWAALFWIVGLQTTCIILRVARIFVIAWAVDPRVDFQILAGSVLFADTVGVIPITPGGIGVRELLIGLIGAASENYEVFLAAAVIDRMAAILLNLLHGGIAVWRSDARVKSK